MARDRSLLLEHPILNRGESAVTTLESSTSTSIKVIDVDTHIIEPYDLWTSRVSTKRWGELVPHVAWDEDRKEDVWLSGSTVLGGAAAPAQAGWHEAPPYHPPALDQVDPSLWRAEDRLALMDKYGIYAQVLYPNVAGFGGGRFSDVGDADLIHALIQAYNDYLTDWSSADPNRLLPIMAIPFWDLELSIAEMERCAAAGHRGLIMSQAPEYFGSPMLGDPHWDRLWAAAQDMQLAVNFHIGGGDMSGVNLLDPSSGPAANYASFPVTFFVGNCKTIATLIGGGICHRFPKLDFVSVESGVGWITFALNALDWMWRECAVTKEHPEYDLLPSEYFRRQIYGCFWFEHGPSLDAALATLGPDNILYETDFPHPTSMSPGPASSALAPNEFISKNLSYLGDEILAKLLHGNAARVYHLD
jgi:predicted TIM-barrel fold metal-dependent hydrolase